MSSKNELSTREWVSVFSQARDLGCVQLGLTGGEPLMRPDITTLVKEAKGMGYYPNLITSAAGLTERRIGELKNAGLDSVQISFQADQRELNDFIGGRQTYKQKMKMMKMVKEYDLPLTLNVVIHRLNIDRIVEICQLCDSMHPDHVEIASTQYHGWAYKNRRNLLPTPEQVGRAQRAIEEYQNSSDSGVYYVLPDLIEKRAKRCQQGWGHTYICVTPQGNVMPCLSANILPSVKNNVPNIRSSSLESIWNGDMFERYRGIDWMNEDVARNHDRRNEDWGGCRCQAFLLTGDECAMDPVDDTSIFHAQFLENVKRDYMAPTNLNSIKHRRLTQDN